MLKEHLDIIYNYYPKGIRPSDIGYVNSPESIRQWQLIEKFRKTTGYFEAMAEEINNQLVCQNYQILSLRGIFDLCNKCILFLPKNSLHEDFPCCVINMSIVVKHYFIYFTKFLYDPVNTITTGTITNAQKSVLDIIEKTIGLYYPGYTTFPMEYFDERVPEIFSSIAYDQQATCFECLMTNDLL
jgi:hypothetical protein